MQNLFGKYITVALMALVPSVEILAQDPVVDFDTDSVVGCSVVAVDAAESTKTIEVQLRISTLLREGEETDINSLVYEVYSHPMRKICRVVDYAPRTSLYADAIDPILVIDTSEDKTEQMVEGRARYVTEVGELAGTIEKKRSTATTSNAEYRKLPAKSLLLASGTIQQRTGVFFKLRPNPQTSLQGERDFSFLLEVPATWRADYFEVRCEARGNSKEWGFFGGRTECGWESFCVCAFLSGDAEAESAAKAAAQAVKECWFAAQATHTQFWVDVRQRVFNERYPDGLVAVWLSREYWAPLLKEGDETEGSEMVENLLDALDNARERIEKLVE